MTKIPAAKPKLPQKAAGKAKPLPTPTKVARDTAHGHSRAQIEDLGLHTSKHFAGESAPRNPAQKQRGRPDGLAAYAQATSKKFI
jgi:hypothetical protein